MKYLFSFCMLFLMSCQYLPEILQDVEHIAEEMENDGQID